MPIRWTSDVDRLGSRTGLTESGLLVTLTLEWKWDRLHMYVNDCAAWGRDVLYDVVTASAWSGVLCEVCNSAFRFGELGIIAEFLIPIIAGIRCRTDRRSVRVDRQQHRRVGFRRGGDPLAADFAQRRLRPRHDGALEARVVVVRQQQRRWRWTSDARTHGRIESRLQVRPR